MESKKKQIAVVIASTITAILALTQIYNWITEPSSDVFAEVRYNSIQYPPELDNKFSEINAIVANYDFSSNVKHAINLEKDLEPHKDRLDKMSKDIIQDLARRIPSSTPYDIKTIEGCWQFRINNNGDKQAQSVKLFVPWAVVAKVAREGGNTAIMKIDEVIDLADMHPRESISISVWTTRVPASYYEDDIKLTHMNGVGDLKIYAVAGPFGRFIDEQWPFIIFLMLMMIPFGLSMASPIYSMLTKSNEQVKNGDNEAEEETSSVKEANESEDGSAKMTE
ncbi:MAG: hypothetical protein O7G85_00970 [Planctomycetota bacterium]|nr:hypothetical protein [Planctomycetota bacterium]